MSIFEGKSRSLFDQLRAADWTNEEERKKFVALFVEARELPMKQISALVRAMVAERDTRRMTMQLVCLQEILTALGGRDEIPALVDLVKTGAPAVRQHLGNVLVQIHDKAEATTLIELLRHEKEEIRQTGEDLIVRIGGKSIYEALAAEIVISGWPSRLEAISTIARIAGHHAIPQLQAVMKNAPKPEKLKCLDMLGNMELMKQRKRLALDAVKDCARDPEADVRMKVASVLGEAGGAEDVPVLIDLMQGTTERRHLQVLIRALGKIGDPQAVKPLIKHLASPYVGLRIETLQALGRFEDEIGIDHLIEGLRDSELLVRQKAVEVLGELGRSPRVRLGRMLVRMMRDRDVNVRRGVIEVIKAIESSEEGRGVWAKLVQHLKDEDWWVRESVTEVLAEVGGKEILAEVIKLLSEKSDIIRRYAIEVIVRMGDKNSAAHLVRAIYDSDWWVRERAVEALAQLKVVAAVPTIIELLRNEDLKWVATKALGDLGDKRAVEPLLAALQTGRVEFRIEVLNALDALRDPRVVEPVKSLLRDPDKRIRHRAEQILNSFEVKVSEEERQRLTLKELKLIDRLLIETREKGGHDLFILTGIPPHIKHQGEVRPLLDKALGKAEVEKILVDILNAVQRKEFFEDGEDVDFSYSIKGEPGRFRVNVYRQWAGPGAVFRVISNNIMTLEQLRLPKAVQDFCQLRNGLVLVTGPTGSGKTTTLAGMIDYINKNRSEHIITIEDPIEYVHDNVNCVINQREIGVHTLSFSEALRAALRQDPDVVLVGELRDYETIATAITAAETGHLVLGTLHTVSAAKTVDRIIDVFPPTFQSQIRMMISESLRGVVSQHLIRRRDGKGLVMALEVLICNDAIANVIRKEKTYQIPNMLQTTSDLGNQLMDIELLKLVRAGIIDPEEGYAKAENKREFEGYLQQPSAEAAATIEPSPARPGAATGVRPRPPGSPAESIPLRPAAPSEVRGRPSDPASPSPTPSEGRGRPPEGRGGHGKT